MVKCTAPSPGNWLEAPAKDTGATAADDGSGYGAFGVTSGAIRELNGSPPTQPFAHQDAVNPTASGAAQAHAPHLNAVGVATINTSFLAHDSHADVPTQVGAPNTQHQPILPTADEAT